MSIYSSLKKRGLRPSPQAPIKGYPVDDIEKMAVLFTDIVGSSRYFRARGDIAGREMLQRHQDLATPPIIEHGGIVVKILGDSVMAYFLDAREALKSAIKIQERFKAYNESKEPRNQIHIRLGIHFGEGIVEEDDIFGDVVNMAAKFLPLVRPDQIVISQEVSDQLQEISSIRLENVDTSGNKNLPGGLAIYNVVWDESINLNPSMNTLVYFKPLFNLGKQSFLSTWENLIRKRDGILKEGVEKELILSDKSLAIVLGEGPLSLNLARNVIEFLKINLGQEATPFVPVQIIIDTGPYLRAGRLVLEDLRVNWKEIRPGEVYISARAYHFIKNTKKFLLDAPPQHAEPGDFYRIALNGREKKESHLFLYQNILVQGENAPCFYCGDKRHLTLNCPSKTLTEITNGLNHLGYLPLEEINKLYFNFLNETLTAPARGTAIPGEAKGPSQWACQGFYELKSVYQLRFFRNIWNSKDESWNRIRERSDDREKGGLVWIGLDCIRVSNLEQAHTVLSDALRKSPNDYKVYCALAFLNIEKSDFSQARYDLLRALEHTETLPQKTFILFLLARVYDLNGDRPRAEEVVRKIIRLNPYCAEALYQDIIFQFRKGKDALALHRLTNLIQKGREYYLHALIDPELARFSEMIHDKLGKILEKTRIEAQDIMERARQELENIKKWLDEDEKEFAEARVQWDKLRENLQGGSYFGYLDSIHFGDGIINMGRLNIERRKRALSGQFKDLRYRAARYLSYVDDFHHKSLVASVKRELKTIHERILEAWGPDEPAVTGKLREASALAKEINAQLDQLEGRLRKLNRVRRALQFITGFFKRSLIFQAANLLVAVLLFPILAYYLNFLIPGFKITPRNIWTYQRALLILGSISAFILAFVTTAKGTISKR